VFQELGRRSWLAWTRSSMPITARKLSAFNQKARATPDYFAYQIII
jgi:hypothetical protein